MYIFLINYVETVWSDLYLLYSFSQGVGSVITLATGQRTLGGPAQATLLYHVFIHIQQFHGRL